MNNTKELISKENFGLGSLFILLSCLCLALMNAFVKASSSYASPQFILFCQFLISFILLLPLASRNKNGGIKTNCYKLHFIRALSGTGAAYCLFFSITMVPLTTAVLLVYSAPLWMTAFAWMFFGEKITALMWLGVSIGFVGVWLVLQPHMSNVNSGVMLAFLGGILMAVALQTVRVLNRTEPTSRILFYYFGFATIVSIPFLFQALLTQNNIPLVGWVYILCVGLTQALSQMLIVLSYRYATPAKLAPYIYSVIVFTAIINYTIWSQAVDRLDFIGVICVVVGGVLAAWHTKINKA